MISHGGFIFVFYWLFMLNFVFIYLPSVYYLDIVFNWFSAFSVDLLTRLYIWDINLWMNVQLTNISNQSRGHLEAWCFLKSIVGGVNLGKKKLGEEPGKGVELWLGWLVRENNLFSIQNKIYNLHVIISLSS